MIAPNNSIRLLDWTSFFGQQKYDITKTVALIDKE